MDMKFIMALRSETAAKHNVPSDDIFHVIFDTGCSVSSTYCLHDFEQPPLLGNWGFVMTAAGPLNIQGFGLASWLFMSDDGSTNHKILVPCHYVPDSDVRLFSPQDYCRYHNVDRSIDSYGGHSGGVWFRIHDSGALVHCHMDMSSNIPVVMATNDGRPTCSISDCDCGLSGCISTTAGSFTQSVFLPANLNLSHSQQGLLLDHYRLGHISFTDIQHFYGLLGDSGVSCLRGKPGASKCPIPLCTACSLAKAKQRSSGAKSTYDRPEVVGSLSRGVVAPGDRFSVDQYESSVRGRPTSIRGRGLMHQQLCGGTLFIDHASGRIFVEHQVSLSADDTIVSKRLVEQEALQCGVSIREFHTDNGIFSSKAFEEELRTQHQRQLFSGVGAHHQNGKAERAIQTVQNMARSMLMHCFVHWPEHYDTTLWPFALDHAVFLYNHTPKKWLNWSTPMEVFCGTKVDCKYLPRMKVWGCPVYVLDPRLQDGKKIPKWEPKARLGMNLGIS